MDEFLFHLVKNKTDKFDYRKIKLWMTKHHKQNQKTTGKLGENIFNVYFNKRLIFLIYRELLKIESQGTWWKTKHEKFKLKLHRDIIFHLLDWQKLKNMTTQCWWRCGKIGPLVHYWWEYKLLQPFWRVFGQYSPNYICS